MYTCRINYTNYQNKKFVRTKQELTQQILEVEQVFNEGE
jgi:flagellar biosynthesis/type III secretory pathway chaperone